MKAAAARSLQMLREVSARRSVMVAFVTIAYCLTRISGLSRELVSEEGMFMMPGRVFFQGQGFNVFHKPPLTSLLLGAFSFVGQDPIVGGRLVPFLIGLFICLLPLYLTSSVAPSILVLVSPFFLAASAHMQTDPTVGLLGYGLVSAAVYLWYRSDGHDGTSYLYCGLIVLWLGKLEVAVIASTAIVMIIVLFRPPERTRLVKAFAVASLVAILSFVFVTWLLGLTMNLGFRGSVGQVVGTVTRISGDLAVREAGGVESNIVRRLVLYRFLQAFHVEQLLGILLLPLLATFLILRERPRDALKLAGAMLTLGLLPVVVYFAGSYLGDGFPRYFLITFPPLLILLGFALQLLTAGSHRAVALLTVLGAAALMLPAAFELWKSPWNITVGRGFGGYRASAQLVGFMTRPGDLILTSEVASYYIPNRRWLVEESFLPYPAKHAAALRHAGEISAAIVRRLPAGPARYQSLIGQLVLPMEKEGARHFLYGPLEIIIKCRDACAPESRADDHPTAGGRE